MIKEKIKFPQKLDLSEFEKKIYNSNLKNFLKGRPKPFVSFYKKVKKISMLSKERLYNIYDCLSYIKSNKVVGDIVEVGCFKGGNIALCRKFSKKKIYGFDTFSGHQEPLRNEIDIWGNKQLTIFKKKKNWYKTDIQEVKNNIAKISSLKNVLLIKGKVQSKSEEIKKIKKISLLIIDVDWFEPTFYSLNKLYSKISKGGFLIMDDYGHHSGARKATEKFFKKKKKIKFFNIDYSCIVMQK